MKITVLELLKKYEKWVKQGKIQFLGKGLSQQKEVLRNLKPLVTDFEEATKKQRQGLGELSENLDWHDTHKKGVELWKSLTSSALKNLSPVSKGNSELFKFIEAATDFEDLLYGLELYYRDHTLHSLWVYFIGEFILREHLPKLHGNLYWYLYNDIEKDKSSYSAKLLKESREIEEYFNKAVNEKRDAIWCIIALCHDLGYSLEKLNKLNEKVKAVLQYVDLPDFKHIGYSLDVEHQYHTNQFLELVAQDVRIVPSRDQKEALTKCYRDDSTYWLLCRALEKKQHGILSSYLIYKILSVFADAWVRGPAEEWGLESNEGIDSIIKGDILFAIAQHQFDFAYLDKLNSLADILVLADELEEFSRLGRQVLSRKYHDTTAEASIEFKKEKDSISIVLTYDVAKHRELDHFFLLKAEQLCRMYSLEMEKEREIINKHPYQIKSIKMIAQKDKKIYSFCLNKGAPNKGGLPTSKAANNPLPAGEYILECQDDKIYHSTSDGVKVFLRDWLGINDL